MMVKPGHLHPKCIIISGPNGAGKTTFAREFLAKEVGVVHFVNPDLIASGLSPLRPELAAIAAGRISLRELDRLAKAEENFAFESTLSGLTYLNRLKRWKGVGYRIEIVYLRIWRCGVSLHALNKGDTTSRELMLSGDSPVAGIILAATIVFWRMPGACMIIRQLHRGCWNKDHETYSGKERNEGILRRRWTRTPPRRQGRAQDRPHARHAGLHLEERQSRRRKTVTLRLGRLNVARVF
jgi:hypothetical protein